MYDTENSSKNKVILTLSMTFISFLFSPILFVISFFTYPFSRYLIVFFLGHLFYLFVYNKMKFQLHLLLFFRKSYFLTYYTKINQIPFISNSYFLIVFSCLFWLVSFHSQTHIFIYILFVFFKFFLHFIILPKFLYNSLFFSSDFFEYFHEINHKNPDFKDLVNQLKSRL